MMKLAALAIFLAVPATTVATKVSLLEGTCQYNTYMCCWTENNGQGMQDNTDVCSPAPKMRRVRKVRKQRKLRGTDGYKYYGYGSSDSSDSGSSDSGSSDSGSHSSGGSGSSGSMSGSTGYGSGSSSGSSGSGSSGGSSGSGSSSGSSGSGSSGGSSGSGSSGGSSTMSTGGSSGSGSSGGSSTTSTSGSSGSGSSGGSSGSSTASTSGSTSSTMTVTTGSSPTSSVTDDDYEYVEEDFAGGNEGDVHCHGFVWADGANVDSFLFPLFNFVKTFDHEETRGYFGNVPGGPMCGCIEDMPVVSRADCTTFSPQGLVACENNDLRTHYDGEMQKPGGELTENLVGNCPNQ